MIVAAALLLLIPAFLMSYFGTAAFTTESAVIDKSEMQADISYCGQFPVTLKIGGKTIVSDVPPVIVKGRTLVPARAIFEEFGAVVSWDEANQQVDISMEDTEVVLKIDSRSALVNGDGATLDVPALIIEDRTMIPVRFVAESLGFVVDWNNSTRTVLIGSSSGEIGENSTPGSQAPIDDVPADFDPVTDDPIDSTPSPADAVYLPAALLNADVANPSQALQNFLNACSGKTVVFPANKTYVLEKQLVIHHVSDLEIDFNGCTFKLPNNCSIASRSDTGHYIPDNTAVVVHDVTNLSMYNYNIDGNKANIASTTWCTGLAIMNADGFTSVNGSFRNCNYHHIIMGPTNVSAYNKDILFKETYFKDHGGASGGAGISDVYVSNRSTDDFSFIGVVVDNTRLKEYTTQAQCFYIAGFNGYFEDVVTNNCAVPLDIRYGSHVAKNFKVTNAEMVLILQPYPGGNGGNGYAKLTASDFDGKGIKGGATGGATGLYIIGCERCHLDDFNIEMDPESAYAWYGIRVRKYYPQFPVNDVVVTNTTVEYFKTAGLIMEGLNASTNFKDLELVSAVSSTYGVKTTTCTAYQYLTGLVTTNCIESSSPDSMLKLL